MTQEEKAKRYDEAIRESSKIINHCAGGANIPECVSVKATIEQIFPELKESEDERTRKSITEFFKNFSKNGTYKAIPDVTKWIAWLERQGEQNLANSAKTCKDEKIREWLINLVKSHIEWMEDRIKEQLSNGQFYGRELNEAKDAIAWLENIGEQKETLCDKCRKEQPSHSCQDITELGRCALEKQGEQKPAEKVEETWIPQSGDIIRKKGTIEPTYTLCRKEGIDFSYVQNTDNGIAGGYLSVYTLKDYELVERPKTIEEAVNELVKPLIEIANEQKPVEWSEEDRIKCNGAIHLFENLIKEGYFDRDSDDFQVASDLKFACKGLINWLKSLRHQNRWKPSDEQMEALKGVQEGVFRLDILGSLYNDLKKLKEE